MKFTEFTEGDNKKVTDETIVNEEAALDLRVTGPSQYPTPANDNRENYKTVNVNGFKNLI